MSSWHFKYYDSSSVIEEMLKLLNEDRFLLVYTDNNCFTITSDDDVRIGECAMMIGSKDIIQFINTDKIVYLELHRSIDKHNEAAS